MDEDDLTEITLANLKMIEESGYKMLDMLNHSLNLFKIEQGSYQPQLSSVDLLQMINKITLETKRLIQLHDLSLEILVNGHVPEAKEMFLIRGEKLLCYSMLANLIKNALEASPKGEQVMITLDDHEQAIIRIHNQGVVPEHIQDKFFEKFVTAGKKTGTGLGTYSAKLMAEIQHGSISMITSEQEGTTVTIHLPKVTITSPSSSVVDSLKASIHIPFIKEERSAEKEKYEFQNVTGFSVSIH
jgi:signal transduction histidine kinase